MDNVSNQTLDARDAAQKIREVAEASHLCMFMTKLGTFPADACPMSIQAVDEDGTLWFLSSKESGKNENLESDDRVMLTIQNDSKYQYLLVAGTARVHTDRATIEEHWTPMASSWFDGKDDPDLTVISVTPREGHFWETKSGKIVSFVKIAFAAATRQGYSDEGIQGHLDLS